MQFLLALRETYEHCVQCLKENERFSFDWFQKADGTVVTIQQQRYLSSSERDVLLGAVFGLAGSVTFTGIGAQAHYAALYQLTQVKLKKLRNFLQACERNGPPADSQQLEGTIARTYFNSWPSQQPHQLPTSPHVLPFQTEFETGIPSGGYQTFSYEYPTHQT